MGHVEAHAEAHVDVEIEKVTEMSEMVPYSVMASPAIVIYEHVVQAGGIPRKEEVQRWVQQLRA